MQKNIIDILEASLNQKDRQQVTYDGQGLGRADSHYFDLYPNRMGLNLFKLIKTAIDYIGHEVLHQDEIIKLSWQHIETYLNAWVPEGYDLLGIIDFVFRSLISTIDFADSKGLLDIAFLGGQEQIALAYVDFLRPILAFRNTEYPKLNNANLTIMEEQFFFCQRFVKDEMNKYILRDVDRLLDDDMLLKTLRADIHDFSYQFILGITPSPDGRRRLHNLRPSARKPFVVTTRGTIEPRLTKKPTHTPEEKADYSQPQSSTLIHRGVMSPAFGFTKERNSKLYGLMTDIKDARVTRALVHDSGTVSRIFDYDTHELAKNSGSYDKYHDDRGKHFYSNHEMDDFKEALCKHNHKNCGHTNEVLARLKFNPYRSVVAICSNSLEARLLAYDFAQELMAHFAHYAEVEGETLNPDFQVPIIFYIKQASRSCHEIVLYTNDMREQDQAQALELYCDIDLRLKKFENNDYEFLLGLPAITLDILLVPEGCIKSNSTNVPLALSMIRKGYVRMLMRLLRLGSILQPTIRDKLIEFILQNKLIKKNDRAITELILAEQFDMADKFIDQTQSVIEELPGDMRSNYPSLVEHLKNKGNPRQIKYTGLDQSWLEDPVKNWVPIMLYIKEHMNLPSPFLGLLLHHACEMNDHNAVKFLIENGAPTNARSVDNNSTAITLAAINIDWEMIALFAHYKRTDPDDTSEYGFALFVALREGKLELVKSLLQAGAKATWRHNTDHSLEYRYRSTLSIALDHGFDELLPQLIEYEKSSSHRYAALCCEQALKLAHEKGNQNAVESIQHSIGSIDNSSIVQEKSINNEVLDAFIRGDSFYAIEILKTHCRLNQLLPKDTELTAYAREWLMALLKSPFRVADTQLMIKLLTIIQSYFNPNTLKDLCEAVLIDLRLRSLKLLENEPFSSPEHYADINNVLIGKSVIEKILEKVPPAIKDVLKRTQQPGSSAKTMLPICMAAKEKKWKLVEQISEYPTDSEDQCEYGFALVEALNDGDATLASLLLKAGAKPTWRNHPSHAGDFRSALCIAIDLGFNDLLPELIEHEKKCTDDYFLMRIENALEHAHDKNNHEAIRIIREKEGPIILFDANNIIPSISRRVLVAIKTEGETIAKERLLTYLLGYHLLPSHSNLVSSFNIWREGLFQRYVSSYLGYMDSFYDLLMLLMPNFNPTGIRARSISGLIDWVVEKPDKSAIISRISLLSDPEILNKIVLDSLLKMISVLQQEVLNKEEPRVGIAPISRAAMKNEWTFVQQFTQFQTDTEDKSEYGYALWAAIKARQVELVELLIRAGAKTTWRNNVGHSLEDKLKSTLWCAIQGELNQLLPQLIEFEKNTPDVYTMLGFEYALELAHEKGNLEAANLIQENVGPITLIDSAQTAHSICRRVLLTLMIAGQPQAEKQLLNYGRQYHLLPAESDRAAHTKLWVSGLFQRKLFAKNGCLVVEGLKIITPHLCAVLLTFPSDNIRKAALKKMVQWILLQKEPSLLGLMTEISRLENDNTRNTFAKIVINTILKNQPYDIALIRKIITLNFSEGFGQEVWESTFNSRHIKAQIRQERNNKTDDEDLLLFDLNPNLPEDLLCVIVDCAIHRRRLQIARAIIVKPNLSQITKSEILTLTIGINGLYKANSLIPLMMAHNYPVAIENLKRANDEILLNLLNHIEKLEYSKPECFWECVMIFRVRHPLNTMQMKRFIALLGPTMIRHILIIHWLMEYKDQIYGTNLQLFYSNNNLGKYHCVNFLLQNYRGQHPINAAILSALNNYFSDDNIYPKEEILIETYNTIMSHIELIPEPNKSTPIGFFKKILPRLKINTQNNDVYSTNYYDEIKNKNARELYSYMQELDQLLRASESTLKVSHTKLHLM